MTNQHDCSRCCISRRQCLQLVSLSALGAGAIGSFTRAGAKETAGPSPTDHVDAASLRPCPEIKISASFLEAPRPYWLGWPGTTYNLDERQKEYRGLLAQSAAKLGISAPLAPQPLNSVEGVGRWLEKIKAERPHAALVILQHMACWDWVPRIAKECGVPLIVFAPVGTAFTGHVAGGGRLKGVHVASTIKWAAVDDALRMVKAKRLFEATRVLWIQGKDRNETVMDRLGVKVRSIPRDTFNQAFDKQPVTEEVKDVVADMGRKATKIVEPSPADLVNSARSYVTAKRLLAAEKANALSMDCLGMVSAKLVPTPPCGGWTMLQDQGVSAGCEADLFGAMSLMMSSYLLDRPGYMNDPVPETYKNTLIASHCTSGSRLGGFDKAPAPVIWRSHSESGLGVSTQVLWPLGEPVTLVRFTSPDELIIDTGKVVSNVDTPPAGGCRTSVELAMDNVEDCRDVLGFHQVVVLGNHRHQLEAFCELNGIRHVHSPAHSTFAGGART
jgi:hypothetical protein